MRIRHAAVAVLLLLGGWSCSRDPNVVKQKYLESGNRYFENGKYREAVIMYRNALRKDMRFGEAYYRLGLTHLRMGQAHWLDGVRALRRAADTLDNQPALRTEARVRLADTLLGFYLADGRRPAGLRAEVDGLVQKLLDQDPSSMDALRMDGYLLLHADRKPKEAIAQLRRAHAVKPFHPPVVLALSQALFAEDQSAEAETLAQQLIQKEKEFGPIYDLLFVHYMRSNRLGDAESIYQTKAVNNPKQAGPLLQLAAYYSGVKRQEDMLATLRKLTSNPKDFPNAFRLVGDFHLRLRDLESAISNYEQGIKANPKDAAELRLLIAQALVAQNRRADALRELDQVLKEQPNNDPAKAMRASLMIDPAHPEQVRAAVTELQGLVSRMPRNAVLRFNLARALSARGELAQTRTQLQEATKLDPSFLPPRLSLARLHMMGREFTQVLQATKEILDLDPRNLEARLLQAQALAGTGNVVQARKEVEEAVKLYPTSVEAVLQLGMISVQERKFKEAEEIFAKTYRANPGDLRAVLGLSEVYALQEQYDKGIQTLSGELAKQPERTDLRVGVANLQVRAQKYDQAIANYKKVLERNPQSSELHLQMGETFRRKGDLPNAVAYFRKAKEISPNDARAYVPLAVLLDSVGQPAEARALYEQILKIQPDNPIALNNLAYMMAESGGDLDQALTLAQRARQRLPQDPNVADTLGWIYIKKNLSDNAIEIFRDLTKKQPGNSTFRYHLGMALFQKGDRPSARKELQAALQSQPSQAEAAKIRELLAKLG